MYIPFLVGKFTCQNSKLFKYIITLIVFLVLYLLKVIGFLKYTPVEETDACWGSLVTRQKTREPKRKTSCRISTLLYWKTQTEESIS